MRIKSGDKVTVITGKDKGRSAKVIKAFPKVQKIIVEGLNLVKRHRRPKKQGEKGQIVEIAKAFPVSKVTLVCPACSKLTKIGYKIVEGKKFRICKKCKKEL